MPRKDQTQATRAARAYHRASAALRDRYREEWDALRAGFLLSPDTADPLPPGPAKGRVPVQSPAVSLVETVDELQAQLDQAHHHLGLLAQRWDDLITLLEQALEDEASRSRDFGRGMAHMLTLVREVHSGEKAARE